MISISVLIVTFNQAKLIGRAIDSALAQRQWGLNEIVIGDDCSTDGNFKVVTEYKNRYPLIFRIYHNDNNLGIYGNMEKLIALRGSADLFCFLAGDDTLCAGWFKSIQSYILDNNIIVRSKAVSFYSDWLYQYPNGRKIIFKQNIVAKGYDVVRLKTRGLICDRSSLVSDAVLCNFKHIPLNKGICVAETMFNIQQMQYSHVNYYVPFIGSVYYCGIGISTTMQTKEYAENRILAFKMLMSSFEFCRKDIYFLKYCISYLELQINPKFSSMYNTIVYYIKGIEPRFGIDYKYLVRLLLSCLKRTIFRIRLH